MLKLSLRALAAHRLRLVLTIVAVILGTAFIAGASIFNSSLSATIESAVDKQMDGVDAFAMKSDDPLFTERDLARLAADDHIARVNIADQAGVVVAHPDLSALQTQGDTSQVIAYYPDEKIVGTPNTLMEGRPPQGTGEVIINSSAAEEFGIGVGDNLLVVHPHRRDTVTVVGLSQPPQELGDDVVLSMDAGGFQKLYGQPGALKLAGDGITDEQLVQHLREEYGWQAQTGREKGEDTAKVYKDNMRPVNYLLNAFGLISLLVGTFLIANTFAMIVSQRIKEFALVRALGASRRQVTGAVAAEAAVVGIAGSAVGVVVGIGLVSLIKTIMARQGMPFAGGHGITVVTVALPLVLGTVVTVVSAWVPARRAGSVHPVAAMRGTEDAAGSPLIVRSLVGAVLVVAGAGCAVVAALFAHHMVLAAIGIVSAIIGYFLAGPALSIPVVPAIGKVIGAPFGAVGRLAATNTRRNPRRAAATAFALTLGVALVSAIGMFGATLKAEARDSVAHDIAADYLLTAPVGGEFSTPREAGELARAAEGVDSVTTLGMAAVTVGANTPRNRASTQ